jgi:hypothetical protein
MNATLKDNKRILRAWMREHYTDERLSWLLAHARSGKLAYMSCCCFIGIVTADHALRGIGQGGTHHVRALATLDGAKVAQEAYWSLCMSHGAQASMDVVRRRILIPMVRAEIKRRDRVASASPVACVAMVPAT